MQDVRPICTEDDYSAALLEVERLWGAKPSTLERDRLDVNRDADRFLSVQKSIPLSKCGQLVLGGAPTPPYAGDLSAESWKMHYIGLGHSLERIARFAPGC